MLAQWVASGEAPLDLWTVDIRRFSDLHRDRQWVSDRTCEAYGKHSTVAFPHEEMASGRPRITSPLHARLQAAGAVFGSRLGWERPNRFAPDGVEPRDVSSMGRQNRFDAVGAEHAHVRQSVGLFDQSSFARYEVTGRDAERTLDQIGAGDITRPPGRLTCTELLNTRGGIEADLTVARLAEDRFYVVTGTGFRTHDFGWIADHLHRGDVRIGDVTEGWGTLSLMGPQARAVLAGVTEADVSNAGFPFGHVREIGIAGATVRALRVTYVGEPGWELHVPQDGIGLRPFHDPENAKVRGQVGAGSWSWTASGANVSGTRRSEGSTIAAIVHAPLCVHPARNSRVRHQGSGWPPPRPAALVPSTRVLPLQ